MVDQFTRQTWSFFAHSKSGLCEPIAQQIRWLAGRGFKPWYVRMDNGQEWKTFKDECCTNLGITIELTAPNTPQVNAQAEVAFIALRNRAHALMMGSDLSEAKCKTLWGLAVDEATTLDNLIPRLGWSNAYEPFMEKPPVKPKDMVRWGSRRWMTNRNKLKRKFQEKSQEVFRLAYTDNSSSDTYLVLKNNGQLVRTRDVVWEDNWKCQKLNNAFEDNNNKKETEHIHMDTRDDIEMIEPPYQAPYDDAMDLDEVTNKTVHIIPFDDEPINNPTINQANAATTEDATSQTSLFSLQHLLDSRLLLQFCVIDLQHAIGLQHRRDSPDLVSGGIIMLLLLLLQLRILKRKGIC